MIANPKAVHVEVLSGADVREKTVAIQMDPTSAAGGFALVAVVEDRVTTIAISQSARALSRWAFDRGALKVRSDYDLRHER